MATFFTLGEEKTRPGVYYRYENNESQPVPGADDGKCACVLRSNWGPLDSAVLLESTSDIATYYGSGGTWDTLEVPKEQFQGGAKSVRAVRLGSGGAYGSVDLLDQEGEAVLRLVTKYVGSRELSVTLRPTMEATVFSASAMTYDELSEFTFDDLSDTTYDELEEITYDDDALFELLVMEGDSQLERITFVNPVGEKDSWDLKEQLSYSAYFNVMELAVTDSYLATITQEPLLGGADPTVDVNSYSNAFGVLETYRWNVLAVDTVDSGILQITQLFLNRIYSEGKFVMGVIGENISNSFEKRISNATSYNDYQLVYVGSGFVDSSGTEYQGYLAAARISGMIAGTPSNESITHSTLTGAVDVMEHLTNSQYEQAILSGMLTFSVSATGIIWVEQGINTLTTLSDNMDMGWKKIKRTKVRFELMQRLNDMVEPLVGKVNNDDDGRMTIVQVCNEVCNTMVAEKKLLSGAKVEVDPSYAAVGDSASFVVSVDDLDSMEKMYYNFKFRFSADS